MKLKINLFSLVCAIVFSIVYYMSFDMRPTGLVTANKVMLNYIGLVLAFAVEQLLDKLMVGKESAVSCYYLTLYVVGVIYWGLIGWFLEEFIKKSLRRIKNKKPKVKVSETTEDLI